MSYFIKHTDQFGDWFFVRPKRWSDNYADAHHFADEQDAKDAANTARLRLGKWCKVIHNKG